MTTTSKDGIMNAGADAGIAMAPVIHPDRPETGGGNIGAGPDRPRLDPGADRDQEERERAFDADYEWNGKTLEPFSIDRESLFSQLRLVMGAPPIMSAVNDFDGFLPDAMRILFICSHRKEDFRRLRRDPVLFQEEVEAWAGENITRAQIPKAIALAMNIYADSRANEHEPVPAGPGERDDSGN